LEVGAKYFERYSFFPDDFTRVTPSCVASDLVLPVPGWGTFVRRTLALARINAYIGRATEAKQFAELGLAHLGRAIALKSEFEKILAMQ
jgi:hypothetical protein